MLNKRTTATPTGASRFIAPIFSCCLITLLSTATPTTAFASASSEVFRSKAILAIADKDYSSALSLLSEALMADPSDAHVLYYRGIVHSRLADYAKAIVDLEAAQAAGVTQPGLTFELGFAAYKSEDYPKAVKALEQAPADSPKRNYYLGLAHIKRNKLDQALAPLQQAALSSDEVALAASFTRAEVLLTLDRINEARDQLHKVLDMDTASIYTQRSKDLLTQIEQREETTRPYSLTLGLGAVSDSNVGLYPNDQPLPAGTSSSSDQRLQLNLDARWKPKSLPSTLPLTFGYRLFQSLHSDLSEFDVRNHAVSVDWRKQQKDYEWGVNVQYITASLDNNDYFNAHTLIPNVTYIHSSTRLSLGKLVWRDNQYQYPGLDGFDGSQYELSYRHLWLRSEQNHVYAGALVKIDNTDDAALASDSYGIEAGIRHVWRTMPLSAGFEYQKRNFGDTSPEREDSISKLNLGLSYPLDKTTHVDISAHQINNSSNSAAHEYDRNLFSVMFRWQL